jgi:hypothetical protein
MTEDFIAVGTNDISTACAQSPAEEGAKQTIMFTSYGGSGSCATQAPNHCSLALITAW